MGLFGNEAKRLASGPAGTASSAGRWPRAMVIKKASPAKTRNVCGSSKRLAMPGAVRARFTAGVWLSASKVPRKPATATGIHGTPWPIRVWYQPCCAITALAMNQPPSTMAAPAASSSARACPGRRAARRRTARRWWRPGS